MNSDKLKSYLDATWSLLYKQEINTDEPILQSNDPLEIKKALNQALPISGQPYNQILNDFEREILPFFNHNTSPNFGAYITGSGNKIAALAEFIKAYYNQNGLKWNNSPITAELEQLIVKWIADFCLIPNHNQGFLTSGGSMSNYMAMHLALTQAYPEREMKGLQHAPKFLIYGSNQTHSSIDRAMVFLGLGREQFRKIDIDKNYQIRVDQLKDQIDADLDKGYKPLMIIGNAGSTNTGSLDPLDQLADIAKTYQIWYHVDGAYGLPAIRIPAKQSQFAGIESADSVIINPHKWMYVPFEASCVLVKNIPQAINFSPDYLFTENPGLRWESSLHTIELSKEFRALKIWFTLKYYGAEKLTHFISHDILLTQYLADQLRQIPEINIHPVSPLSILCFRYEDPSLNDEKNEQINIGAIRAIEQEGKIFITGTKLDNKTHFRIYFGNPMRTKSNVDHMITILKNTLLKVLK